MLTIYVKQFLEDKSILCIDLEVYLIQLESEIINNTFILAHITNYCQMVLHFCGKAFKKIELLKKRASKFISLD